MTLVLRGWQRLWIVLSILWLGIVATTLISAWPTTTDIDKKFLNDTYRAINKHDGKNVNFEISDLIGEFNRRNHESNTKDETLVLIKTENWAALAEHAIAKRGNEIDFRKIRASHNAELRLVNKERKEKLFAGFQFVLFPVVATYIVGLIVGRVIRGLKS